MKAARTRPFGWFGIALLALGILTSVSALAYAYRTGVRMATVDAPLLNATMEIQFEVTLGHLWFEKILYGDRRESMDQVRRHYDAADRYAKAMLEGGRNARGRLFPLDDPGMREDVQRVRERLASFRQITTQRWEAGHTAVAGTPLDQKYDRMFRDLLARVESVENDLGALIAAETTRFRWTFLLLIAFSVLSFCGAGWAIRRRTAERNLAEREGKDLAKFPSENPDPVLRVAKDGNVLYANATGRSLLEHLEAGVGKTAPDDWRPAVEEAFGQGKRQAFEVEYQEHVYLFSVMPIGGAEYVNIYGHDITERKRAAEKRRHLETQIQHAQKLESLGVLAGGIAHDFNNLLMAILGNADLALMDMAPEAPARENVSDIKKASQRAAELAKQMLAYSGKGRFVIEALDLSRVIEEMTHMLEVSVSKKAVLKYNFAENLPAIEGDATQIRQVIMNLITNASEAIGQASGIISITTGAMQIDRRYLREVYLDENLPEGLYVTLEVADTGCGMEAETRARLFDPFFTTKFAGRGLGMAAVLGIVRGHHGAIKVYSEPGQGTTMKVLLPAVAAETAAAAKQADADGSWRSSATVLLVDDEETVRAIGKMMLEHLGLTVITASDGCQAVDIFRERGDSIDCVILDLTMPHMDGEGAFRELRRIRKDIRVIMSSGYNQQDVTQRFVGKGIAGFIQKPYELKALAHTLQSILGR